MVVRSVSAYDTKREHEPVAEFDPATGVTFTSGESSAFNRTDGATFVAGRFSIHNGAREVMVPWSVIWPALPHVGCRG